MSKENKGAREFWIQKGTPDLIADSYIEALRHCYDEREPLPIVHVIKYSAFEKCQAEKQALQAELKEMQQQLSEREMEIEEFEGLREVSGKNRVRVGALEQRLAEAITLKEAYQDEASASYKEIKALEQRLAEAISDAEKLVAALKQYEATHIGRLNDNSFMKVENPARKAVNEWKEKYRG